jgi:hypothetical protein
VCSSDLSPLVEAVANTQRDLLLADSICAPRRCPAGCRTALQLSGPPAWRSQEAERFYFDGGSEFQNGRIKVLLRRVLAIRVDPKGHNPQNEQYFLVRPTKKPWVTKEQCHAGGNATPKGTPLFEGNYFVCGDLQEGTGHRAYALVTGLTSVVTLTLPAVVHDAGDISFDAKIQTADGQAQYLLHSDTHEHLMEKGSLTATT